MHKFFTKKEADFIYNLLCSPDNENILLGLSLFFQNVTKPNLIIQRYPKHKVKSKYTYFAISQKYSIKDFKRFWIYYRKNIHLGIPTVFLKSIQIFIRKHTSKNR